MVEITDVASGSLAEKAGLRQGDILLDINGHEIGDVLDYRFYLAEKELTVRVHRGPQLLEMSISKSEYADIGLDFASFLMDGQRRCQNKCVFCFIDQLPPGMRETLYFKDDDSRMSFLAGSYVTLTNMRDADIDRIIQMRISPIHISVHTTDPDLRVRMMKNPRAAQVMDVMRRFAAHGIEMHAQIVLCKGWNDGEALTRTLRDLGTLYPAMQSVSVVPIGLTRFRERLTPMTPFSGEDAAEVIRAVSDFASRFYKRNGTRLVYASDEWYLKAALPLPEEETYEGYPQLDNGVGMLRSMQTEIDLALADQGEDPSPGAYSIATGLAAYDLMCRTVDAVKQRYPTVEGRVYAIQNDFFGEQITVAGLITGQDLINQLRGKPLGTRLLLPAVMLRHERDRFLDDVTPETVEQALGVKLVFTETNGFDLIDTILFPKDAEETNRKEV